MISTRGRTCFGRWYPRPDRYVIFINKIAETYNPEEDLEGFLACFLAVEFHELGHIYGFRNGCKRCKEEFCYWCFYTDMMFLYFGYEKFHNSIHRFTKDIIKEI